ncbi:MAG: TonB-dependent receptor domain-containing protein [Steroidobacteraceae bacterium]
MRFSQAPWFTSLLLLAGGAVAQQSVAASDAKKVTLHIPPQPVSDALSEFGRQTGLTVMIQSVVGRGVTAPRLEGDYVPVDALDQLLAHTGLHYEYLDDKTVAVLGPQNETDTAARRINPDKVQGFQNAAPTSGQSTGTIRIADNENPPHITDPMLDAKRTRTNELDEVVVTGTHIRGPTNSASPVQIYKRDEIDRTGAGTVEQFLRQLPQNFNGGASDSTVGAIAGGSKVANVTGGTGVNLRGLGNDATIVLVNGRRIAAGSSKADFVDISLIPLTAVERVEIVTDGASAIYGSDAVGGVINFILRKDFNGAETRARYSSVGQGSSNETSIGQTLGHIWDSGSALLSYEYYDRTPLNAADRSYTNSVDQPFTLLPRQVRHGALLSFDQSLSSSIALFGSGLFGHRSEEDDFSGFDTLQHNQSRVTSYNVTLGSRIGLTDSTELEISSTYGSSDTSRQLFFNALPLPLIEQKTVSKTTSVDGVLNGSLWSLPAGRLRYAAGAQYRRESFNFTDLAGGPAFNPARNIIAGFAEIRIPLIGPSGESAGVNTLELTIADRGEHYSDFGSTNNPKIGLVWDPTHDLRLRGTYGTSFVAPLLSQLNPIPDAVYASNTSEIPGSTPSGFGDINTLQVYGGNPNLTAQKATTWSAGLDWRPQIMPGFAAKLTYYSVRFKNRIATLQGAGIDPNFALLQIAELGPQIVQLNPPNALVQQLTSGPNFLNFGADLTTGVGAIIHDESFNIAAVHMNGLETDLAYRTTAPAFAQIEAGLDATYLFKFDSQFTSGTPVLSVLNTLYNPTRIKMRGRLVLTRGSVTGSAFVNYVSNYDNTNTLPRVPIASWTTVDLTGSYECRSCNGFLSMLRGLNLTAGVLNVANRNPPYAANANGIAVNFDGANANPLGRYFTIQMTTKF